jgi:hypothetical protein
MGWRKGSTNFLNKSELLELATLDLPQSTYKIDKLLKSHAHQAFQLLLNHCNLNVTEDIWITVQDIMAYKNINQWTV